MSVALFPSAITPVSAQTLHTVTNAADSGPGTLRQALADAAVDGTASTITFAPDINLIELDSAITFNDNAPLEIDGPGLDA